MSALRLFVFILSFGVVVVQAAGAVAAEPAALPDAERVVVEKVVHDYLVAHPEVLVEAMGVLRQRQEQAENEDRQKALKDHRADLYDDPATPVAGNPHGNVTVVEFFDYSCPYCKSVEESLQSLLSSDSGIRLVLKEFPVLGANSQLAAKAALAARSQGKYLEFHNALMTTRGQFTEETLLRIARSVGIDTDRLKADLTSPAIEAAITANHALAEQLAIRGTPAFIIGGVVYSGAMDLSAMRQAVAAARKG